MEMILDESNYEALKRKVKRKGRDSKAKLILGNGVVTLTNGYCGFGIWSGNLHVKYKGIEGKININMLAKNVCVWLVDNGYIREGTRQDMSEVRNVRCK